jgi:hypothetical protein
MKSSVLYVCLTIAVVLFALRVFAAGNGSFYDQLTDLYAQSVKIPSIDKAQGVWFGQCYPRTPDPTVRVQGIEVEAFIKHWHWDPPKGSPLKPIDADKFQIRPKTSDPDGDWGDFLAQAGQFGTLQEYAEEHISPNNWGLLFPQPELQTAAEADLKADKHYIYVWLRAVNDAHWACYLSFDHRP